MRPSCSKLLGLSLLISVGLCVGNAGAQDFSDANTTLINVNPALPSILANADAHNVRMSENGRFIVFDSAATNLVNLNTGGNTHVYLFDRQAGTLELVDLRPDRTPSTVSSFNPSVSNDGRYVSFTAAAPESEYFGICVSDRCHVNKWFDGTHVYVRDRVANETMLASQVTLPCKVAVLKVNSLLNEVDEMKDERGNVLRNADGTSKLKPRVVVKNKRVAAAIRTAGGWLPATSLNPRHSASGQFTVYDSDANNLAGIFTGEDPIIPDAIEGVDFDPHDGQLIDSQYIVPPIGIYFDGNGKRDVFLRDGATNGNSFESFFCKYYEPNRCFPIMGEEDSTNPSISDDGSVVAFHSKSRFLDLDFNDSKDVFVVERENLGEEISELFRVSNDMSRLVASDGESTLPDLSGDGRFVVFQSSSTDLVSNDTNNKTDVFVFDRSFNDTFRCSVKDSTEGDADSLRPSVSGNGSFISFDSSSTTFGATGGKSNVYVAQVRRASDGRIAACSLQLASTGLSTGGNGDSTGSSVAVVPVTTTLNGIAVRIARSAVAYLSLAANLVSSKTVNNGKLNVFQAPVCTEQDRVTDTDGDGTSDCFDQCHRERTKVVDVDSDGDGVADCEDACAADAQKVVGGLCGCGKVDSDTDADRTPDCLDACPLDPLKVNAGQCGCGVPDTDTDRDGIADCKKAALPTPGPTATVTPGGPTPVPTTTTTPTVPNYDSITPRAVQTRRIGGGTFQVSVPVQSFPAGVSRYRFRLIERGAGDTGVRRIFYKSARTFRLRLPLGSYKLSYSVVLRDRGMTGESAARILRAL